MFEVTNRYAIHANRVGVTPKDVILWQFVHGKERLMHDDLGRQVIAALPNNLEAKSGKTERPPKRKSFDYDDDDDEDDD